MNTNNIGKFDLHTHLFGCLTAADVWEIGRDRVATHTTGLEWYAREYQAAVGRTPNWRSYWQSPSGLTELEQDFLLREPASFAIFQAKFNLLIALFPLAADSSAMILQHVGRQHARDGLTAVEYRTLLPMRFTKEQVDDYLGALTAVCEELTHDSDGVFSPRLALSLPRPNREFTDRYQLLRSWLQAHPRQARYITGIDLCGFEEPDPPRDKVEPFRQISHDNSAGQSLKILHHVGESFVGLSLASAARRVFEAGHAGADRLGHALALGLAPELFAARKQWPEARHERLYHLTWLQRHASWLAERGYLVEQTTIAHELEALQASNLPEVALTYDDEAIATTRRLQDALMRGLAELPCVIESCPTSNHLISAQPLADHPLRRFLENGLRVCIGSDDPGIMATSLDRELRLCADVIGSDANAMAALTNTAREIAETHLDLGLSRSP